MYENQSCAPRRLHQLLCHANDKGALTTPACQVLQSAINATEDSLGILDFFYILRQAHSEARLITDPPSASASIPVLTRFHEYVLAHDVMQTNWVHYRNYIDPYNVIPVVDALAHYYSQQYPSRSLGGDFLNILDEQLRTILQDVDASDLPRQLKKVIASSLNGVLQSVHNYRIDGTTGVKRAVQALIAELLTLEIEEETVARSNKTYHLVSGFAAFLLRFISPSLYDVIGAGPDIQTYWLPAIQQLYEATSDQDDKFPPLQENLKNAREALQTSQPNSLTGTAHPKALLPPTVD